jgi:hypothetical protein
LSKFRLSLGKVIFEMHEQAGIGNLRRKPN